jgi:hypothetical protein
MDISQYNELLYLLNHKKNNVRHVLLRENMQGYGQTFAQSPRVRGPELKM